MKHVTPSEWQRLTRGTFVSVDPSSTCTGIAVFEDWWLAHAMCVRPKWPRLHEAFADVPLPRCPILVEWPQIYNNPRARKKDPNSLLMVAAVAGAVMRSDSVTLVGTVLPRDWKGQVSKEETKRRVLEELGPVEKEALPSRAPYDLYDAIGIGLWALGRYK